MANDDIVVGLKVKLDEESVAREAAKAGEKMGRGSASGRGGGGGPANIAEGIREAVTRPIIGRLEKIEQKLENLGTGAKVAAGAATAILVIKYLQEMYYALKAVLASLWNLSQSLSRFSPAIRLAFRDLAISMKMLSLDLGRLIGTELANLVSIVREIIQILYAVLRPVIKIVAMALSALVDAIRVVIRVLVYATVVILYTVSNLIRSVGSFISWLSQYVPGQVGNMLATMGMATQAFAGQVSAYAKSIQQAAATGQNAAKQMNQALIKGFSDVGKMAYAGVSAPGAGDERAAPIFAAPLKLDSHGTTRTYTGRGSQSAAAGRMAMQLPAPSLATVVNNVQLKAEVKLQHEEAVQRAIEEVRGCLVKAIHQVRNEQLNLSSRIYARTVIDL
jgi:hypothetical protein